MYTNQQKKAHIKELQKYLHVISYYNREIPGIIPNGVYDKPTENAVKAFQRAYGLTDTGEVNTATWDKIVSVYQKFMSAVPEMLEVFPQKPDTVMHRGDHCYTVAIIQAILFELSEHYSNLPCVHVTGDYDTETVQAVQLFQKISGLPVTGEVDCQTWNMLAQMGCDLR